MGNPEPGFGYVYLLYHSEVGHRVDGQVWSWGRSLGWRYNIGNCWDMITILIPGTNEILGRDLMRT